MPTLSSTRSLGFRQSTRRGLAVGAKSAAAIGGLLLVFGAGATLQAPAATPASDSAGSATTESDKAYCDRQEPRVRDICYRQYRIGKNSAGATPTAAAPTAAASTAAAPASTATSSSTAESDKAYCDRQEPHVREICYRQLKTSKDSTATAPKAEPAPVAAAPAQKPPPAPAPAQKVAAAGAAPAAPAQGKLYTVTNGNVVDAKTYQGFETWRAAACDRCHGANQEGMVGPSLINSLKTLSKADFVAVVTKGRLEKGMPSFGSNPVVTSHIDALYAYLKGRSDGAITSSRVKRAP